MYASLFVPTLVLRHSVTAENVDCYCHSSYACFPRMLCDSNPRRSSLLKVRVAAGQVWLGSRIEYLVFQELPGLTSLHGTFFHGTFFYFNRCLFFITPVNDDTVRIWYLRTHRLSLRNFFPNCNATRSLSYANRLYFRKQNVSVYPNIETNSAHYEKGCKSGTAVLYGPIACLPYLGKTVPIGSTNPGTELV